MGKAKAYQIAVGQMIIRFKKGKHQWKHKPDTLTCVRDDGTVTWTHLHSGFVHHDFAHYVVETTLGFENAFFGLVAKGYDIPDFSEPKATRLFEIPREAMNTEPIVSLLQAEVLDGGTDREGVFRDHDASLSVSVTDAQLELMRQKMRELLERWHSLQPGASMTLHFKI